MKSYRWFKYSLVFIVEIAVMCAILAYIGIFQKMESFLLSYEIGSIFRTLPKAEGEKDKPKPNFSDAYNKSLKALEEFPEAPEFQLSLGLSLEGLGQNNKALGAYKVLEESVNRGGKDPLVVFISRYNQGEVLGQMEKVDEALEKYQSALEVSPDSKEAKTNIELLIQKQQGQGNGEGKDDKDQGKNSKDPKKFDQNPKDSKKFKSEQLSEGDVRKILDELKQQEQKIRGDFDKENNRNAKEKNREKDW